MLSISTLKYSFIFRIVPIYLVVLKNITEIIFNVHQLGM